VNYSFPTSKSLPKVRWINELTWCCDRHIPPTMIPAKMNECWYYGCTSRRPLDPPAAPVAPPEPEPVLISVPRVVKSKRKSKLQLEQEDQAIIAQALKDYHSDLPDFDPTGLEPVQIPMPVPPEFAVPRKPRKTRAAKQLPPPTDPTQPQPTAEDRKQGRSSLVACESCGAPLWRRPTEVAQGKVFYCPDHRRGGKPR
jgi:hypothetical protein